MITGALAADRARGLRRRRRDVAWPRPCPRPGTTRARRPRRRDAAPDRHVRRAARRAGPRPGRPRHGRSRVGTAIWPHGRWRIDLAGEANHAGTTRLVDRDDADARLADVVLAARAAAERHGAVATCGKVQRRPERRQRDPVARHGAGWTRAAPTPSAVRAVVAERAPPALGGELTEESWTDRDAVRRRAGAPAARRCSTTRRCSAPAPGTTPGILAAAGVPTAMLFVRNPTGVSHSPAEFAERRRLPAPGRRAGRPCSRELASDAA